MKMFLWFLLLLTLGSTLGSNEVSRTFQPVDISGEGFSDAILEVRTAASELECTAYCKAHGEANFFWYNIKKNTASCQLSWVNFHMKVQHTGKGATIDHYNRFLFLHECALP